MKEKDPIWTLLIAYVGGVIVIVLFMLLLFSIGGCEVLKKKSSVQRDSTVTAKVDSGTVNIRTNDKTDSLAWWREIINLSRDTTIVTPGVTNVYPTSYIREGGTRTIVEKSVNYDSLWKRSIDSLSYRLNSTDKSKETKVLTQWYIWVIAGAVALLLFKSFFKLK